MTRGHENGTFTRQAGHGKKQTEDKEDSDTDMSDSDDEENAPPVLHLRMLCLTRGANRIRNMPQKDGVIAVWEDSGTVKVNAETLKLLGLSAPN